MASTKRHFLCIMNMYLFATSKYRDRRKPRTPRPFKVYPSKFNSALDFFKISFSLLAEKKYCICDLCTGPHIN